MRKIILNILAITLFYSCGTVNLKENVPTGRYNIKDLLHYEELELNEDGTFKLIVKQPQSTKTCEGKWTVKSKQELLLNGIDTKKFKGADSLFYEKLNCKDLVLKFENSKKIKKDSYYLKKLNN